MKLLANRDAASAPKVRNLLIPPAPAIETAAAKQQHNEHDN